MKDVIRTSDGHETSLEEIIDNPQLPAIVRIFLVALHDYGAYLVDGSGGLGFVAEDKHTADLHVDVAKTLINEEDQGNDDETPWEAVIGTLNDYLSWRLFDGDGGLPLGFSKKLDGRFQFWSNFEVVEELEPPQD